MSTCHSELGKRRKRFPRMLTASWIARCRARRREYSVRQVKPPRREVPARHFRKPGRGLHRIFMSEFYFDVRR